MGPYEQCTQLEDRTATAEGRGCQERAKGKLAVNVSSGWPAHGTQMLRWTQARPGQFLGHSWALGESGSDGYLRIENIQPEPGKVDVLPR